MYKISILIVVAIVVAYAVHATLRQPDESLAPERLVDGGLIASSIDTPTGAGGMIDMRSQGLTSVPKYIFNKYGTEVLLLSDNNLNGSLPAEVRQLKELQVLDLSNNNFTGVPAEIGQLQKLEILNLSDNPITGLPLELGNLKNLKVLDLRGTQYSQYDLERIQKTLSLDVEIKV